VSHFYSLKKETKFEDSLLTIYAIAMPLAISLWWFSGYYGQHFSEAISFLIRDGHCDTSVTGFGNHCFGDFVYSVTEAKNGLYFVANSAPANLFYILVANAIDSPFSTSVAILGNLILTVISLSAPAIWSSLYSKTSLYKCLLLFGPFSYPALTVLDRGSNFGFSVPFLLAFSVYYLQGNNRKAVTALVVSSIFKPHLLVLLVLFLITRKSWYFFRGVRLGLALHLTASLIIQPDLVLAVKQHILQLSSYGAYVPLDDNTFSNLSIAKMLRDLVNLLPSTGADSLINHIEKFPTQIGLFVFCLVSLLLWRNHEFVTKREQLTILLPLSVVFPGVAFAPYLSIVLIVIAIQIIEVDKSCRTFPGPLRQTRVETYSNYSLLIALSLSICPLVLPGSYIDGRQISTFPLITFAWINFVLSKLAASETKKQSPTTRFLPD
jgi:hypothetical protein